MLKGKGLGVLTFYYLGYSRIRNLFFRVKHKPVARFVGFHDILSDEVGCLKNNLNFLKRNTNVVPSMISSRGDYLQKGSIPL